MKNDAGIKLLIHGDKTIATGEKDGSDDEPPAELRAGKAPRFPQCAVQQGLIDASEYKFLGEAGHYKKKNPALSVKFLADSEKEKDCGHGQSQESSHD